jgi:polyvinyl alcohol dehydrogenase (cytochrome)
MAATADHVYAPVADTDANLLSGRPTPGEAKPGLNKLDIYSGEKIWHYSTKNICDGRDKKCRTGISAAITGIPGAILAPTLDGILRAISTENGSLLWQFDSTQETLGVNGVKGHGGTLDAGGVVVTHGMLVFNSGYGGLISAGGKDGNVLWVLRKKL